MQQLIKDDDPKRCPNCGRRKRWWRAHRFNGTPNILCFICDRRMQDVALRRYRERE